jgi:hypothetical protein
MMVDVPDGHAVFVFPVPRDPAEIAEQYDAAWGAEHGAQER